MEDFLKAIISYINPAVKGVVDMESEDVATVSKAIVDAQIDGNELPLPTVFLMDLMSEDVIKRLEGSENEVVKNFVSAWNEKVKDIPRD